MNSIELKLGRDMQTLFLDLQESEKYNEQLQDAINIVLEQVVYPIIDKNLD